MNSEEIKVFIAVFEHNCNHARHVENERLWFTNVYVLTVAGIFALLSRVEVEHQLRVYSVAFLIVVSILGFLMSWRLKADFQDFMQKIKSMINDMDIAVNATKITKLASYVGVGAEKGITTKFKLRWIFMVFYCAMTVFLILVLLTLFN